MQQSAWMFIDGAGPSHGLTINLGAMPAVRIALSIGRKWGQVAVLFGSS
jgi:hypothetical protein